MKKIVKEFINEEYQSDDENQGMFIRDDGWDEDALEEVGLIDWLDTVQRLQYEIKNARRGSYAINGDTAEDLLNELHGLQDGLNNIIDDIHGML